MGTNYYAVMKKPTVSDGRVVHIGKSSYGWLFGFQDQDEKYRDIPVVWHSYPEVKKWLKKYTIGEDAPFVIMDEYDRELSYDEFIKLVEDKQKDPFNLKNEDNFKYNRNVDGYRFTDGDFS